MMSSANSRRLRVLLTSILVLAALAAGYLLVLQQANKISISQVERQLATSLEQTEDLEQVLLEIAADLELAEAQMEAAEDRSKGVLANVAAVAEKLTKAEAELTRVEAARSQPAADVSLTPGFRHSLQGSTPPDEKIAFLTFDDGPSLVTGQILDILGEYEVPATFFVNGRTTSTAIAMYKRIVDEGHALGNHTYTHRWSELYTSIDAFFDDLLRLETLLVKHTGVRPSIVRFPGGSSYAYAGRYGGSSIMDELAQALLDRGYYYFDWNVNSGDSVAATAPRDKIVENVLKGVRGKNNAIILLHDLPSKTTTAEALPEIIEELHRQGYRFEALNEDSFTYRFR
ncbi:MAG: polysaccharide deacetylase [Firmicutes bacterium]|nr:polysaccharide deacetylase [Bacillota bacterium]